MKSRREFLQLSLAAALHAAPGGTPDNDGPENVVEATLTALQEGLTLSHFTSVQLV